MNSAASGEIRGSIEPLASSPHREKISRKSSNARGRAARKIDEIEGLLLLLLSYLLKIFIFYQLRRTCECTDIRMDARTDGRADGRTVMNKDGQTGPPIAMGRRR